MKYESARAFRQALEERIRRDYEGNQVPRVRKMIAFERLMARLDRHWILKGGYDIHLRTDKARATQDVDLFVAHNSLDDIEAVLRQELNQNLDDYFEFILDVGYADPLFEPIDLLTPPNFLDFAQVEAITIPCYSIYQHIAEKVHSIVRPRISESSRVKDLVDLILLAGLDTQIEADSLKEAIALIFNSRADSVPNSFDPFPASWRPRYNRLAQELQLPYPEFQDAYRAVSEFISPVLSHHALGLIWEPKGWHWE